MTSTGKMLERALSTRRPAQVNDEVEGDGDAGDESKTRKHVSSVAIRFTYYLTRTGYLWPVIFSAFAVFVVYSVYVRTRDLVCISASSSDHISRLRFFGFDGLESDFGSLGVPWCKFCLFWCISNFVSFTVFSSDLLCIIYGFAQ